MNKLARIVIIAVAPCHPSIFIAILNNPCKAIEINNPRNKSRRRFLVLNKDSAKKNPILAEQRACKNVAPINLPLKASAVFSMRYGSFNKNRIKMFSNAAKPKPTIII